MRLVVTQQADASAMHSSGEAPAFIEHVLQEHVCRDGDQVVFEAVLKQGQCV
jgi:hypothetical protein